MRPDQPTYRRQVLDHRGLVAGLFDALGLGDVIDQATHHHPEMRDLTTGEAVNAMGLHGLGWINHARYLGPRCFQHQPTSRLMAPRVAPDQRTDEARGRALATLSADGVTDRYRLLAATAAERLGLTPRVAPRERTRVPVDGRDNRAAAPAEPVMPRTRGYSRAPRPDLTHVMWELSVAPQAGSPRLRPPRRGTSREVHALGQVIRTPLEPWHPTSGVTAIVADRARYRAATRQQLAQTARPWSPRVPATWSAAPAALAPVDPQALASLPEGARAHEWTSTDGGMAPRWVRIDSEPRQLPAQRTLDRPRRQPREAEVNALKT